MLVHLLLCPKLDQEFMEHRLQFVLSMAPAARAGPTKVTLTVIENSGRYNSALILINVKNISKSPILITDMVYPSEGIQLKFLVEGEGRNPLVSRPSGAPKLSQEWFFLLQPSEDFTICRNWSFEFSDIKPKPDGKEAGIEGTLSATYDIRKSPSLVGRSAKAFTGPATSNGVRVSLAPGRVRVIKPSGAVSRAGE